MASKQDLALTDNVSERDPSTGLTVRFLQGTKFSDLPSWLQDKVADNPLLLKRVRVESREVLVDIDDDTPEDED